VTLHFDIDRDSDFVLPFRPHASLWAVSVTNCFKNF